MTNIFVFDLGIYECSFGPGFLLSCREAKHKNRATFGTVLACNLACVVLHDAVGSAQSEPSAFAHSLSRIERIKNPVRLRNAGASIGELDYDFVFITIGIY